MRVALDGYAESAPQPQVCNLEGHAGVIHLQGVLTAGAKLGCQQDLSYDARHRGVLDASEAKHPVLHVQLA